MIFPREPHNVYKNTWNVTENMPSQITGLTPKSTKNRAENARFWYAVKLFTFFITIKTFL